MRLPTWEQFWGAVLGGVLLALALGALFVYPMLWIFPAGLFGWWVVVNERKIKNHSPTGDGPAQEGVSTAGEGVRRVDVIAGGAAYVVHPEPIPAHDEKDHDA